MVRRELPVFLLLLTALGGCATNSTAERGTALANKQLEQSGSPFRWSSTSFSDGSAVFGKELIGNSCTTSANAVLQHDVLASIGKSEIANGGAATPVLVDVRCISITSSPSQVNEAWVIVRGKDKVVYTVSFRPQTSGGTDFEIHGPWGKV